LVGGLKFLSVFNILSIYNFTFHYLMQKLCWTIICWLNKPSISILFLFLLSQEMFQIYSCTLIHITGLFHFLEHQTVFLHFHSLHCLGWPSAISFQFILTHLSTKLQFLLGFPSVHILVCEQKSISKEWCSICYPHTRYFIYKQWIAVWLPCTKQTTTSDL
jgi:hypothetical protein